MGERIRYNFFLMIRIILMLVFASCGFLELGDKETGVSVLVLLLVSFFLAAMSAKNAIAGKNIRERIIKTVCFAAGGIILALLIGIGGKGFIILGFFYVYELLSLFGAPCGLYFLPVLLAFVQGPLGFVAQFLILVMLTVCYLQQEYVIEPYRQQLREETVLEQRLKRSMEDREQASKAEMKKNMLAAGNKILEERSNLAQALHDKLGHNINGSIYQLEAIKVLMEKEPEKSKQMTQAVIDQLRTGMDEIRAILRKERPERKELALLQLYKLCGDCSDKGVEAELETEGDIALIDDGLWEVILDNAVEALSNSMKYSKCKKIIISIKVMNRIVKCSIKDDGRGCPAVIDGMGISGMKMRVRSVNGSIDIESMNGFTVNMLLPLKAAERT